MKEFNKLCISEVELTEVGTEDSVTTRLMMKTIGIHILHLIFMSPLLAVGQ